MKYFDYSATTPVRSEVLDEFKKYFSVIGNEELYDLEKKNISNILNTDKEIIFTSGSTESNNMAIKGILLKYNEPGYHIITTKLEHSSVKETLSFFEKKGFIIDYVDLVDGAVDLESLKNLICDKTVLVTISAVDSEVGLLQPINDIGLLLKEYPNIIFHCDMTQSIGKVNIDFSNVDLISFSSHKIYGIKGIGCLLKNKDISLIPIMYGERTYNYALIKSFVKALDISISKLDENYYYILKLNLYLREKLSSFNNIVINSNDNSVPHILNISVLNYKPETFLHFVELDDFYISTKSACSSNGDYSVSVYSLCNDMKRAKTSVRISLSYMNTYEDIDNFINFIKKGSGFNE